MRLKVYHIVVEHGTKEKKCTCSDETLTSIVDALPDEEELVQVIKDRLRGIKVNDAPVTVHYE